MLRCIFTKCKPKKIFYLCYKNFDNEKLEEELKKHLSIVVDLNRSTRPIVQRSALKKSCAKHQLTFHDKNSS